MMEKDEIINSIKIHEEKIKSFGISMLGLFGSFAREEQTPESDVDLLYEFEEGKATLRNLLNLINYLEDLLKCKIELVPKKFLSPHIGPKILDDVEFIIK